MSFVEESGHETNEIDTTVGDLCNPRSYAVRKSSAHIGQKAYRDTITGNLQSVPARHSAPRS
jgi:hypothetical protein